MTEEVQGGLPSEVVEAPAATPENVAAPESETQAAPEVKTEAETKSFTQAELDAIIQKEKAKAEAKAERRAMKAYRETLERVLPQSQQQQQQPQSPKEGRPTREQFVSDDDYVEAMADWKLEQRDAEARKAMQQQQARTIQSKTEGIYAEAQKIAGFDREAFDELPLTQAIAAVILDSDVPGPLMAYMASNPEEVERISKLPPARQAAAIGKLEDKVSAAPAVSKAPPPMKPVGSRGSASNSDLSKASMEEYISQRAKQGARWAR